MKPRKLRYIITREDVEKGQDYDSAFSNPEVMVVGKTVGCGCCSDTIVLTEELLKAHIGRLKEDIAKAEAALELLSRPQKVQKVTFKVLEDFGDSMEVQCPKCQEVFGVDPDTNVEMDSLGGRLTVCPKCGAVEK